MGWFDRKKEVKPAKPMSEDEDIADAIKNPTVRKHLEAEEGFLHQHVPGSEKLMPLLQAMLLSREARLAYAKQVVDLYEKQTGESFLVLERSDKDVIVSGESPRDAVQNTLKHLRVLKEFPVGEQPKPKAPEQNNEYFDQFDHMMGFLMKRLDGSQPMVDQVSRLIDAVNLDHIGVAVKDAIEHPDKTVMRGRLKDRVIKYLVAMNKM